MTQSTRAPRIPKMWPAWAAALLAGCAAGPQFHRPAVAAPAHYRTAGGSRQAAPPTLLARGPYRQYIALGESYSGPWWALFRSVRLDALIRRALADNHDIAAAEAAVAEAREQVRAGAADRLPQVMSDLASGRQKYGAEFLGPNAFAPFSFAAAGVSISYRLDYIGATARSIEQRRAMVRYRQSELQAARLTLTAEVARQAVVIAAARAQIAAVNELLAEDRDNLGLVRRALAAGSVPRLDVLTAQAQLAGDETRLPPLYQRLARARHALAVLLGRPPASWHEPDPTLSELILPRRIPVSVPSQLLRHRPDILAAQAELHAATAAVGVATANLYPHIDLTGSLGQQALRASQLFDPGSTAWSLIAGITEPLFDGGRLRAERRAALDTLNASAAAYQQVVVAAFGQVADALDALHHDAQLCAAQARAQTLSRGRLALERESYLAGNTGLLPVLDAERQREHAALGLLAAEERQYLDTIGLLLAVGGGLS